MITLYKGDDTGGQLGKNVKIVFHCDDAVDMDDVVVKFDLLGIVKREFTDVHDGDVLDIFISHAESRKFPLGVIFAKMWGEDASGKLRTFANRIPFRVTLNLIAVYGSDGTDSQDIHVYSSVDWDSIANKPTTFPSTIGLVDGLEEALSGKASAESVESILDKIPSDASAQNQLADKEWVDGQVESVAAYYITFDAQGSNFPTHAALINAQTYYSGGAPRVPTRNDYAVVLADETHDGAEYRYIFAKPEGSTVGQWEAQYPIESVITFDDSVTLTSPNAVRSSGIWSAIWGALAALPTGFTSLYDWCVSQLAGKADRAANPTAGNLAALDAQGNLADSRKKPSDFQNALTAQQLANIAAVSDALAFDATRSYAVGDPVVYNGTLYTFTAAHTGAWTGSDVSAVDIIARLAGKLDKSGGTVTGDFTFSSGQTALRQDINGIYVQDAQGDVWFLYDSDTPNTVARLANIPYSLGAPTVIDTASSETVEGETVYFGAATLANRTANIVQVTAATPLDELRITFPAATNGKVRDFGLRVEIGTGSAALAAPALVPIAPTGETIKIENADGTIPALADGTATAKGVTLLYFSETAPGVFVVKGEQVEEVA